MLLSMCPHTNICVHTQVPEGLSLVPTGLSLSEPSPISDGQRIKLLQTGPRIF
jgi:hypothetical protein